MRRRARSQWLLGGCALFVSLAVMPAADAQWFPYYGGYYPYGGWGGFGWNTTRRIHEEDRLSAQARAAQQEAIQQESIRGALEANAQMRSQASLEDRRVTRDWWMGVQDRDMTLRRAATIQASQMLSGQPSEALYDQDRYLIAWPVALRLPVFASERQRIETPFVRFAGGGPPVSVTEYETIVSLTASIRQRLNELTGLITALDFIAAQEFLDRLDAEAKGRITMATQQSGRVPCGN